MNNFIINLLSIIDQNINMEDKLVLINELKKYGKI